jgi:hypothetical protein
MICFQTGLKAALLQKSIFKDKIKPDNNALRLQEKLKKNHISSHNLHVMCD